MSDIRASEGDVLQRLHESEYRYSNLFNAMAVCFWELDFRDVGATLRRWREDGVTDFARHLADPEKIRNLMLSTRVVDCNERTIAVFGEGSKEALITTIAPFWPPESYAVYAASVLAYVKGQKSFSAETTLLSVTGQAREVLFTACFPDELATAGSMLVGILDLSETKQALRELRYAKLRADTLAEAQAFAFWQLDCSETNRMLGELKAQGVTDLRAYMDENPDFVVQALKATIVTDINQKSIELYGLRDKSDALGKSIFSYWLPGSYEAFEGSIEAGFNGKSQFQMVTRTRTFDGREVDCRFWMAAPPEMRASGTVMVAIQDLTEEIAQRREIEALREGLAHAGRVLMLGEFAASIAHEINQPLTALKAASSAARRWLALTPPDLEQASTSLTTIAKSAHRAGEIVDRIRGMAVKRQPQRERVEVKGLIEEAIDFLSRELHAFRTVPVVIIPRDMPGIFVDRTQIQQVLVNLILNALQAMDQAGSPVRKVTVSVEADTGAAETLTFCVRDSGPGFEPDHVKRLFEHFFTTKEGGMGIGLTICQSIIQAHEGHIEARNGSGGGAEFTFTLPAG